MTNDKEQDLDAQKEASTQGDVLKGQLGNMLSSVEGTLAVTCDSIMGQMKQLEEKIQDMEKRYSELKKEAEDNLKQAIDSTSETKGAGETADEQK